MNERIRKIAIETDAWCDQHYTGDPMYDIKWEQKFAELIVRECIDTVLDSSVEYCTRPQIVSEIKEHFG
jgi:hypothetical protein